MKKIFTKNIPFLILALLVGTAAYSINGYMSLIMMDVIDFAVAGNSGKVLSRAISMGLVALVLLVFQSALVFAKGKYRKKVNSELKKGYLEGVFDKNINEFNKENLSAYISGITNDINTLDVNYVDGIFELALSAISFAVIVIVVASVNTLILGIIVLLIILVSALSYFLSNPIKKLMMERSGLHIEYTGYLSEVLNAFRIIKSNDLCDRVKRNFHQHGKSLQEKSYQIDKVSTYIFAIQNVVFDALVLGIMVVSVYFTILGEITFGGIILIFSNLGLLIGPFRRAGELLPKIISSNVIFKKLDGTLINLNGYEENAEIEKIEKEIVFENVSFGYDDQNILEEINIRFIKGNKYLIVGPSGGGKSTLMRMLRKYHYPKLGEVYIDGVKLSSITKKSYFRRIANIDQNIFIFDNTFRNNLTLYREVSDEKLKQAIENSGLENFLHSLPDGLNTVFKDNGINISGGEKSRIAIARALISECDMLLMDEAFSSLDYETAKNIEKTILQNKDLTVINVSHLIIKENIEKYDEIFRVKNKKALKI